MADILELSDEQLDSVSAGANIAVSGVPDSDLAREIAKACPGIQFFYNETRKDYCCAIGVNGLSQSYRYTGLSTFKAQLDKHNVKQYLTTDSTFSTPSY
ncbi:MAG: hypothetical protein ACI4NE_02480 [Succinivibrio sp.]